MSAVSEHHARSRALSVALEPVAGSVYFAPEAHAAYAELGFGASPGPVDGNAWATSHWPQPGRHEDRPISQRRSPPLAVDSTYSGDGTLDDEVRLGRAAGSRPGRQPAGAGGCHRASGAGSSRPMAGSSRAGVCIAFAG